MIKREVVSIMITRKRKEKRRAFTALVLVVSMLLSGFASFAAAAELPFTDVPAGAWYYDDVAWAYESGLINGKSASKYAPNDKMSYAEAVKLAACMHQLKTTGAVSLSNGNPWYQPYVDYAKTFGLITGDLEWKKAASRAGYMQIFAQMISDLEAEKNTVVNNAIPDVQTGSIYANAIYKLYRAGIVQGTDSLHNCSPNSNIQRSEVATILTRMMDPSKRVSFTMAEAYTGAGSGTASGTGGGTAPETGSTAPGSDLISAHPQDCSVKEGGIAVFSVAVKKDGLSYQWQQDNPEVVIKYGACVPGIKAETASASGSVSAPLLGFFPGGFTPPLPYIPHVPFEPNPQTVLLPLNFSPAVSDFIKKPGALKFLKPNVDVQVVHHWSDLSDAFDIKGSKSDELSITATFDRIKSGGFRCIVKDGGGNSQTSEEASLIVLSPGIKISAQPKSQRLKEGDWATLGVTATGSKLSYKWKTLEIGPWGAKIVDMVNGANVSGADTANLKVKAVGAANPISPTYFCEITDAYGLSVSSSSAAVRAVKLQIIGQPKDVADLSSGQWFSMSVIAVGDDEVKYRWQWNDAGTWRNVSDSAGRKGCNSNVLETNVGGEYRCVMTDSFGAQLVSDSAKATGGTDIGSVIQVTKVPKDVTAKRGWLADFSIEFSALGDANIRWQKNSYYGWTDLADDGIYSGVNAKSFSVLVDGETYADEYRCHIEVPSKGVSYDSSAVRIKQELAVSPMKARMQVYNKCEYSAITFDVSGDRLQYRWFLNKIPTVADFGDKDPDFYFFERHGSKFNISSLVTFTNTASYMRWVQFAPGAVLVPDIDLYCLVRDQYGGSVIAGPYKFVFDYWKLP